MTSYEIFELSRKMTWEELETLMEKMTEYDNQWRSVLPGLFFIVPSGWGDLFMHEIIDVDVEKRELLVKDHSVNKLEIFKHIPSELYTKEEFEERYPK